MNDPTELWEELAHTIAAAPEYLGAEIGFLAVLHT